VKPLVTSMGFGGVPVPQAARDGVGATTPPAPEMNVHDTTSALAKGDAAVFSAFYRFWFPRLLGLAKRATGRDEAFALDVVQDAFVRVIRAPKRCGSEGELSAWLRAITLSAAVDRLRREARREAREAKRRADSTHAPDAAVTLDAAECLAWLAARLEELAPDDRDLLRLRFEVRQTLGEISARGGGHTAGWAAVHGRIRRAVDRLRKAAGEYFA
jgi:RNA polymerase sigma factor (sigma-70 family)